MRTLTIGLLISIASFSFVFAGGGDGPALVADGLIVVESVQAQSCLALRVDVPSGKALTGIRWFNGANSISFRKILIASGAGEFPPAYDQFAVMEENVFGQLNDWSEVEFFEPVASLTNTLFVILQYPPFYEDSDDEPSLGIGFQEVEAEGRYYVSSDGDHWVELADHIELLLEPVYVDRETNMVALSGPAADMEENDESVSYENGLLAIPNPFNPETRIALTLEKSGPIEVTVFDVRGRAVRHLFADQAGPGLKELIWNGKDDSGRGMSSGVYWARVKGYDFTLKQRLVLIK